MKRTGENGVGRISDVRSQDSRPAHKPMCAPPKEKEERMKNRKKWLAWSLAACMVCSVLAGCGGKEDAGESSQGGSNPPNSSNPQNSADGAEDGPLTPYEETLVITQVRADAEGITYVEGEDESHNFVSEMYRDKLNIEWKTVWNSSDYFTKLNLDIQSNELADVFFVDKIFLQLLIQNEQIEDLTSYYETYATDLTRKNCEYADGVAMEYPTVDGKIYAIPWTRSTTQDSVVMYLREDWRKQLNLSVPTTWQELKDYIKAIKDSGLPKDGSSGFAFSGVGSYPFSAISNIYGAQWGYYVENEGGDGLIYSPVSDNMKTTVSAIKELANEGLIDGDWASKDATMDELIANGTYGIAFGPYWYFYNCSGNLKNDENADWECYAVPNADENTVTHVAGGIPAQAYLVVRKGYEHPEALIKSLNLWFEMTDPEGEYMDQWMTVIGDRYKAIELVGTYSRPYDIEPAEKAYAVSDALEIVYSSDNPEEIQPKYPIAKAVYGRVGDPNSPEYRTGTGWWTYMAYAHGMRICKEYDKTGLLMDKYQGMLSEEATFNKSTLDNRIVETITNIILGDSIDAFDAMVTDWYAQGGDRIMEEVNDWYSQKGK